MGVQIQKLGHHWTLIVALNLYCIILETIMSDDSVNSSALALENNQGSSRHENGIVGSKMWSWTLLIETAN